MASYTYCDHTDHDSDGGKFTPAVCTVRVSKQDKKNESVINTTKAYDSCEDHIGAFVQIAWASNHRDPQFYRIVVDKFADG